jgi:CRISPR-associated protein Cas1
MVRTLHELPRFGDRWSYLYLEMGRLDRGDGGLLFHDLTGDTAVPVDQLSLLMLGPGRTVTHRAVQALAENAWTASSATSRV